MSSISFYSSFFSILVVFPSFDFLPSRACWHWLRKSLPVSLMGRSPLSLRALLLWFFGGKLIFKIIFLSLTLVPMNYRLIISTCNLVHNVLIKVYFKTIFLSLILAPMTIVLKLPSESGPQCLLRGSGAYASRDLNSLEAYGRWART